MRFLHRLWERKLGSAILLLALVLVCEWYRGFFYEEGLEFSHEFTLQNPQERVIVTIEIASASQGIFFSKEDDKILKPLKKPLQAFNWWSFSREFEPFRMKNSFRSHDAWRHKICGFVVCSQINNPAGRNYHRFFVLVPYWSVIIPLTLLSAWLLVRKPRPAKSNTKPPASAPLADSNGGDAGTANNSGPEVPFDGLLRGQEGDLAPDIPSHLGRPSDVPG